MTRACGFLLIAAFLLGAPALAAAQLTQNYNPGPSVGTGSVNGLVEVACVFLYWVLIAAAAVFVVLAVTSYLTSYGDPEVSQKGTQRMFYAIVTVLIAVLVRGIPILICGIEGCG